MSIETRCVLCFLAGYAVGGGLLVALFNYAAMTDKHASNAAMTQEIELCEANLPRNQTCEIVLTTRVRKEQRQ